MQRYPAPNKPTSPYDEDAQTPSRRFYRWLLRFFPWPFNWLLAPIALLLLLAHMLRLFFFPPERSPLLPLSRRGQEIFVVGFMIVMVAGLIFLLFPALFR